MDDENHVASKQQPRRRGPGTATGDELKAEREFDDIRESNEAAANNMDENTQPPAANSIHFHCLRSPQPPRQLRKQIRWMIY